MIRILKKRIYLSVAFFGALAACVGCQGVQPAGGRADRMPRENNHGDVAKGWTPGVWTDYVAHGPDGNRLPDFSHAGCVMGRHPAPFESGPLFDVTGPPFNAVPGDGRDDTTAIQAAIDAAAGAGGGVVFMPRGRYDVHSTPDAPFLQIRNSGIVLRGEGSHGAGTTLHLGAPGKADRVRRLVSVPAADEARHWAAVAILGGEDRRELTRYRQTMRRGNRIAGVVDSAGLSPGQTVIVEFVDPAIDPARPGPQKADLAAQLTAPFKLGAMQTDTFGGAAKTHTWRVKIEEIIDSQTIRLDRPARFDQWLRYDARIYAVGGVHDVGIEHLRIQSSWPGAYRHHKPFIDKKGRIIRTAKEQDYLWNGIWISHATDGWVRDVTFKDLTQGIIVCRSSDLSMEDIEFHGLDGHAGITIAHSNDTLVRDVDYYQRLVHPVTLTMMANGNVVTRCTVHYEGRDDTSQADAVIDFHGIFPYENLFDNLKGVYVCPGGDLSVMPHAGVRNVFWNIEAPGNMSCYTCDTDDEFARTYDLESTTAKATATMFEHFPQAFYVGLYRRGNRRLTIGGTGVDRHTLWMTVEGLNRPGTRPPSLFDAQRNQRIFPVCE